jgi:hypothetical protein
MGALSPGDANPIDGIIKPVGNVLPLGINAALTTDASSWAERCDAPPKRGAIFGDGLWYSVKSS